MLKNKINANHRNSFLKHQLTKCNFLWPNNLACQYLSRQQYILYQFTNKREREKGLYDKSYAFNQIK